MDVSRIEMWRRDVDRRTMRPRKWSCERGSQSLLTTHMQSTTHSALRGRGGERGRKGRTEDGRGKGGRKEEIKDEREERR